MSRDNARARVHRAEVGLGAAEHQLAARWQTWRERIHRQRLPLLIGTGFFGGLALTLVAPKHWANVGAVLVGGSARLARSAIGPALLGALWANVQSPSSSARTPAVSPSA